VEDPRFSPQELNRDVGRETTTKHAASSPLWLTSGQN